MRHLPFPFGLGAVLLTGIVLSVPVQAHDPAADKRGAELFKPGVEFAAGTDGAAGSRPPLVDGLGSVAMTVTTASPDAQAYFNQGLRYIWAFNHAEAVRSFRAAQQIDPSCAMCYWGEAFALGPNLNDAMHDTAVAPAWAAIGAATTLAGKTTPLEQALIVALRARYAADGGDRAALDAGFAAEMRKVAAAWPQHADIQVILADALMNLQPWDYWETGGAVPKGNGADILAALDRALKLAPNHPAALHLYIHAVEASNDPARAEAAADRLRGAAPAAGHLVHMPAHIYNRVGRYADSIAINRQAIAADEAFLAMAGEAASPLVRYGYYPHNVHFLLVGAQMAGLKDIAIEAGEKLARVTSEEFSAEVAWTQAIRTAPYSAHAQFSDPETILALDDPGDVLPLVKGFWHYARGVAFAAKHDWNAALAEQHAIETLIATGNLAGLEAQYLPARAVLGIAKHVVEARIAQAKEQWADAEHHLHEAIALEDGIPYMEPPYWYYPVRQTLAAVQLAAGRPDEAAKTFAATLKISPRNGWALWGMFKAQEALGNAGAITAARVAFEKAWLGDPKLLRLERL